MFKYIRPTNLSSAALGTLGALSVYSLQLGRVLSPDRLGLEDWWKETFGHDFNALTENEGRYLLRYNSADSLRNSILARRQEGLPGTDKDVPPADRGGEGEAGSGVGQASAPRTSPPPATAILANSCATWRGTMTKSGAAAAAR